MKKLIMTLTAVVGLVACAADVVPASQTVEEKAPVADGATQKGAADKLVREAKRYGYAVDDWCALTKKARKEIRQEALAKKKGMTVAEMKAERNRKDAEKAGCSVEEWQKMSVKERCAFRKAKAQAKKEG